MSSPIKPLSSHKMNPVVSSTAAYKQYIITKWKDKYFPCSDVQERINLLQQQQENSSADLDERIFEEVTKLCEFMSGHLSRNASNMTVIKTGWSNLSDEDKQKAATTTTARSAELLLKLIQNECELLLRYYHLNYYFLLSISSSLNERSHDEVKSEQASSNPNNDIEMGRKNSTIAPSFNFRNEKISSVFTQFLAFEHTIMSQQRESVRIYSVIYVNGNAALAKASLEFPIEDTLTSSDNFELGLKIGLALAIVAFTVFLSLISEKDSFQLYDSPGIFIFSSVGNILLFQLLWAIIVYIWEHWKINYVAIMQIPRKRNYMRNIDSLTTLFIFYGLLLVLYFQSNTQGTTLYNETLGNYLPLILLCVSVAYVFYKNFLSDQRHMKTSGTFTINVIVKCCSAPFYMMGNIGPSPTFRDVYVANVMASFSKVLTDFIRGLCWVTDSLIINRGRKGSDFCESYNMSIILTSLVSYLIFIRFSQCIRRWVLTGCAMPHAFNAMEYAVTLSSVLSGFFFGLTPSYLGISLTATIYEWAWNTHFDWGLWSCSSSRGSDCNDRLLRDNTMFKTKIFYHIGVFIDFILRFMWIISLQPELAVLLFGPMASTLLGSLELFRRAMWSIFRLEWEHTKVYSTNKLLRVKTLMANDGDDFEEVGNGEGDGGNGTVIRKASLITQSRRKISTQEDHGNGNRFQVRSIGIVPVQGQQGAPSISGIDNKSGQKRSAVSSLADFEEVLSNIAWGGTYT